MGSLKFLITKALIMIGILQSSGYFDHNDDHGVERAMHGNLQKSQIFQRSSTQLGTERTTALLAYTDAVPAAGVLLMTTTMTLDFLVFRLDSPPRVSTCCSSVSEANASAASLQLQQLLAVPARPGRRQ